MKNTDDKFVALLEKYNIDYNYGYGSVGDGWLSLLENLFVDIINLGWDKKVAQIKEKFGGLRVYIYSASVAIHERIHKAELDSYKICEDCGKDGKAGTGGKYWIRTLCEEHEAERTKALAEMEARCSRCDKNPKQEKHLCPYQHDVEEDSESFCDCCEECTQNCSDDV